MCSAGRGGGSGSVFALFRTALYDIAVCKATVTGALSRQSMQKIESPPHTKPTAKVPPPRLYQPGREVPELTDVPGPHRWPLFGGAR